MNGGGVFLGRVLIWCAAQWAWCLVVLGGAAAAWWLGADHAVVVWIAAALILGPAAVDALGWAYAPRFYSRFVLTPLRGSVWLLWLAFAWRGACESAHLGYQRGEKWRAPRIIPRLSSSGFSFNLRTPRGMNSEDVERAVSRLAGALRATSHQYTYEHSSRQHVRFTMVNALRGLIAARPPASAGPVFLGVDEEGSEVLWEPTQCAHAAIQGRTRSGKSTQTYVMLAGVSQRPDVVVVGSDPTGILLGPWKARRGGAWIATGTAALEEHARVLEAICAEMDSRICDLMARGLDKFTGSDFSATRPVLLVVLEEWPGLLASAAAEKGMPARLMRSVERIMREGAKVGVIGHALAQQMRVEALSGDARGQTAWRASFAVDGRTWLDFLHGGASLPALASCRSWLPGVGVIERPGFTFTRWRSAFITYSEYREAVADAAWPAGAWIAPELPEVPEPAEIEAAPRSRRAQPKQPRSRAVVEEEP